MELSNYEFLARQTLTLIFQGYMKFKSLLTLQSVVVKQSQRENNCCKKKT
jgi:hypothetical protein